MIFFVGAFSIKEWHIKTHQGMISFTFGIFSHCKIVGSKLIVVPIFFSKIFMEGE
jgi:hypothetical protein